MAAEEKVFQLSRPLVRFDLFELDAKSGQLRRAGLPVDLSPQALRVLVMLVERPGDLIPRKDIKEELWPGQSYGDFDSRLNFTVKKLREALGDDAEQPRYVQTVRNSGYRFIAPVREPSPASFLLRGKADHSEANQHGTLPEATHKILMSRRGLQVLALAAVVFVTVVAAAVLTLRERVSGPSAAEVRAQSVSSKADSSKADSVPEIASVTPILPQARQRIVIKGRGFGLHVPYVHTDSPYIAIRDETAHWAAGRIIPQNYDDVMVDVESWTDTQIVVSGFSGDYGRNGWKLNLGDSVVVAIWNPQSGVGPGEYNAQVSANTP